MGFNLGSAGFSAKVFFLLCMLIAGFYGAATASQKNWSYRRFLRLRVWFCRGVLDGVMNLSSRDFEFAQSFSS